MSDDLASQIERLCDVMVRSTLGWNYGMVHSLSELRYYDV